MKVDNKLLEDIYWDDEDAFEYLPRIKGMSQDKWSSQDNMKSHLTSAMDDEVVNQLDTLRTYNFSYEASRHEEWWLFDSLGPFYDEQWFDDVIRIIKGGKEASVYLCKANASSEMNNLAAKVYRPRSLRNLRKDHIYREGRPQLDSDGLNIIKERELKAIMKHTSFGKDLMHTSWIEHEYKTLQDMFAAGCDVPKPFARGHNAILMSYIGDERNAAPTLNALKLEISLARDLFTRTIHNIQIMLQNQRVHGDLSAYNILYWDGSITLIDFPQAINPLQNPNAYQIFQRDLLRICDYFRKQGVENNPHHLAEKMWTSQGYSTLPNYLPEVDIDNISD